MVEKACKQPEQPEQPEQPMDTQHGNGDLKSAWGTQQGGYLYILEHVPERYNSQRDPFRNKETGPCHLPTPPLSINTEPPVGTRAAPRILAT